MDIKKYIDIKTKLKSDKNGPEISKIGKKGIGKWAKIGVKP